VIVAVLDANAFDVLAKTEERLVKVGDAVARGALRLLTVRLLTVRHVRAEVAQTPDPVKRARLGRLQTEDTPALFLLDHSLLDGPDVLAGDADGDAYAAVHTTGDNHLVDGQVLAAAARNNAVVVTVDKRLRVKAIEQGCPILLPAELLTELGID
jgi:hypothetical protein